MHKYQCVHEPFIGSGVCIYNSNGGGQGRDINPHVVVLHNVLKDPGLMDRVLSTYAEYFPEGCNAKDSYNKLRDDLNVLYMQHGLNNENAHMLYILIQMSFNSLFRFSSKGFNAAYGEKPFDPGRIEPKMEDIPKVISGIDQESLEKIQTVYSKVIKKIVPVSSTESAEMCKLYEN